MLIVPFAKTQGQSGITVTNYLRSDLELLARQKCPELPKDCAMRAEHGIALIHARLAIVFEVGAVE